MKKLISSVVALSLLSALLTGCNVVTNTPSSTVSTQTSESSQPAEPLEGASIVLRMSHGDNDTSMLEYLECLCPCIQKVFGTVLWR